MIIDILKAGYKTVKEHKLAILGMSLPSIIVAIIASGFSNTGSILTAVSSLAYNPEALASVFHSSLTMMLIISMIVTLFKVSLQMGLFESDKDSKFEFKRAFVAFSGFDWIMIIGISFLLELLFFVIFIVFIGLTGSFFVAGLTEQNSFLFAVSAIFALVGLVIYAYVALGLYFIFLTYYADTKNLDNGLFKSFPKTWKLMKGHRYQLLGLIVLQFLMVVVAGAIFIGLVLLVSWLISLISVAGISFAVSIVLGLLVFAIGLIVFLFFQFWFTMNGIKFFEKLNK